MRQSLHESIACALETMHRDRLEDYYGPIAHHYCQTAKQAKALEYLDLANRKAEKASAMLEAIAYFERAIAILDDMPETEANLRRRLSLISNQRLVYWLLFRTWEYYDLLLRNQQLETAVGDSRARGVSAEPWSMPVYAWIA
jgi:predicted ATPase